MKLTGEKWENYSTKCIDHRKTDKYWMENYPQDCVLKTSSLGEMRDKIDWMIQNAELNHKDIYSMPFFVNYEGKLHTVETSYSGTNSKMGMVCGLELGEWDRLEYTAPDVKPEGGGEYWSSRGPSSFDCSGYIKSKPAGERLLRMVKYVLEKDECKTWLDFRDFEPDYIQFKFSAEEFDVEKLDELARANNDILTEDILRECVKEA